ncbi:MAG: MFS transporter [Chloroflexota bacterium]
MPPKPAFPLSRSDIHIGDTFAALHHRNYRLWFLGQMVSLAGSWMQMTAQGYLVYQLTGSEAYLGLIGGIAGIPTVVFMLFGGVAADRIPRRNLLVITQSTMMVLALVLAGLAFTSVVQPWHVLVMALLLSIANAFDAPARVAFVREMVPEEDMNNAIALNATMFNVATVSGPAIAGITYSLVGPAWCFLINGLSFIAILAALSMMKIEQEARALQKSRPLQEILEGLRYVRGQPLILSLTVFMGVVAIFGMGTLTLLPAWAVDVLGGDVTTNGLLISARGLGSLIGALMLASLGRLPIRGKLWLVGSLLMPAVLLVFAYVSWLPLSLLLLVVIGWSFILIANNSNAMIQSQVHDELRGRVMSIYTLVFFSSMPLGSLFAGFFAQKFGAIPTVAISAGVLLGLAVATNAFIPRIRQEG